MISDEEMKFKIVFVQKTGRQSIFYFSYKSRLKIFVVSQQVKPKLVPFFVALSFSLALRIFSISKLLFFHQTLTMRRFSSTNLPTNLLREEKRKFY
jgi:hypothetical protein